MKLTRVFNLFLLIALLSAGALGAFGGKENDNGLQKVEASGTVRMVGSGPFAFLVLSGESREWIIEPAEQKKLMNLQQQTVTVKAKEYYQDMFFANGLSAGRHYYLKNITVVSK